MASRGNIEGPVLEELPRVMSNDAPRGPKLELDGTGVGKQPAAAVGQPVVALGFGLTPRTTQLYVLA
jgi:hypothetical protein